MVSSKIRGLLLVLVAVLIVMVSSVSTFAASSTVNNKTYTHPAFYKAALYRLFHGVDVSVWQGKINWRKSKADGIDFAILRCGYTALNKFRLHQDSTFTSNYSNAKKAGVSVGIYYYACATTSAEAKKEANYVISILKNNNVNNQLPVVMDYEINAGRPNTVYNQLVRSKGKAYARKRFTNNAKKFMNILKASGYETMFYSYRALVDPKFSKNYRFNMSEINGSSQYRFWLAQYSTSNSYSGKMELWQFSSTGRVKGMSGNIDRNFWYYPLAGVDTDSGTTNIRKCKVTLSASEYKYDGNIKQPKVTVKNGTKKLKNGTDYAVSYMNNIKKGTATVLIHGKGSYSNETYSTFKIGNKNVGDDKTTDADDVKTTSVTPDKVRGLITSLNLEKGTGSVTVKWNETPNATRYRIAYKIDEASKFKYIYTKKLTYTIKDIKEDSIVSVSVRAQNIVNKKVKTGDKSVTSYRYMKAQQNTATVISKSKICVTMPKIKDEKGTLKYQIVKDCVDISKKTINTVKNTKVLSAEDRYFYDISVRPLLIAGEHTYIGIYGAKTHPYVNYGKISKITAITAGFKVSYPKTEGIGNPKYKISYSRKSTMENAKTVIRSQDKTTCKVKNLKSGKKYYVTMQTFKKHKGVTYYGVVSNVAEVVTK